MTRLQRWTPHLIGLSFIVAVSLIIFHVDPSAWWQSNLGHLLTGTAACFTFLLALFKLGPELEKWHKEKQADREQKQADNQAKVVERNVKRSAKVADAAEKLALATVDFIQAIMYLTSVVVLKDDPPATDTDGLSSFEKDRVTAEYRRKMFYGRLERKQREITRFYEAKNLARVLLPMKCYEKAEEIAKELKTILVEFDMHAMFLASGDKRHSENEKSYKAVFSTTTKDRLEKLENELLEMLRPLAQEYIEPE